MSEEELARQVELAAHGDADALQRLIVHYHATLRGVVAGAIDTRLRRYIDPDDILQETYISAFKSVLRAEFDGPRPFYKWLERIARNQVKDTQRALRQGKRDVTRELPNGAQPSASFSGLVQRLAGSDASPSRLLAEDEAVAAVMTCLARLGDEQRDVIRLRILEDVPVAEVAQRLGKSDVAVYALCRRGLDALHEMMGPITRFLSGL